MSKNYEIEWIPDLLDQLSSLQGLDSDLLSDIMLAQACLQANVLKTPKKKKKKKKNKKRKRKIQKGPPYTVSVEIRGALPHNLSKDAFRAAIIPLLEDYGDSQTVFISVNRMNNGTYCYNFTGRCPIHGRIHDGGARIWQLKQHPKDAWCGFKCWRGDTYRKLYSIPILCDF